MTKTRVALLYGGQSAEHAISIQSAATVLDALDPTRFDVVPVLIHASGHWSLEEAYNLRLAAQGRPALPRPLALERSPGLRTSPGELGLWGGDRAVDVVFPMLHGPRGEDGSVQGLLELAGVPYVGAGVLGSAVGMDKDVIMKRLLRDAGLPVTPFVTLRHADLPRAQQSAATLGYPLYCKPAGQGSSVGVSRVLKAAHLDAALAAAWSHGPKIMLETAVPGMELECSVVGNAHPVASVGGCHPGHP